MDWVEVWSAGCFRYAAFVDEAGGCGRLLWVIEDGTACRRLFLRGDTVTFYLI
ncbi:hypothetical protein OOZ51_21335 [Arthrobacter sp. MI7-26]|uniref:hypothetical protein n=1 Tax=Arthrobacter sp. MI7-26 TaxID=2993653 RepID=UPI002248D86F|nr:hypothetical protein [Arthrobacter sp. MI7-26]MCX2750328.1 hypothetical protein [Arthrobacter sp. MI7-26]